MKHIEQLTESDGLTIWAAIGHPPHTFNFETVKSWLIDGEVEGFKFDAIGLVMAAKALIATGYAIKAEGNTIVTDADIQPVLRFRIHPDYDFYDGDRVVLHEVIDAKEETGEPEVTIPVFALLKYSEEYYRVQLHYTDHLYWDGAVNNMNQQYTPLMDIGLDSIEHFNPRKHLLPEQLAEYNNHYAARAFRQLFGIDGDMVYTYASLPIMQHFLNEEKLEPEEAAAKFYEQLRQIQKAPDGTALNEEGLAPYQHLRPEWSRSLNNAIVTFEDWFLIFALTYQRNDDNDTPEYSREEAEQGYNDGLTPQSFYNKIAGISAA